MEIFDSLMKETDNTSADQEIDFEADLMAQELDQTMETPDDESPPDEGLTKPQQDCFTVLKQAALGESASMNLDLGYLVEVNNRVFSHWQAYSGYDIKYIIDLFNKCADLSHTHRDGLANVKCLVSHKTYPEQEVVYLITTLKTGGKPREIPIHKGFLTLCYTLFFVLHFREHLITKIKGSPEITCAEIKPVFDTLEKSLGYLEFNLPTEPPKDIVTENGSGQLK